MANAKESAKKATVVKKVVAQLPLEVPHLLRERQVLQFFPVSRGELWLRVKDGRFPRPVKLSPKISAWRSNDILAVLREHGVEAVA